ncbi:aminotransferase class V-fold PLP-dependent enzyme [Bacillus salipaludis]|uniref:aminotransferase class V-fold PLP-dependent enzyme n=1 Tax=Bacillus salipaludis TaxID=2547811 RepID=UPI003D2335E7
MILLDNLIDENTKLVAVTLASNVVGALPMLKGWQSGKSEVEALLTVDAVHATRIF